MWYDPVFKVFTVKGEQVNQSGEFQLNEAKRGNVGAIGSYIPRCFVT